MPVLAVMSMLTVIIIAQTSSPRDCHMIVITQGIGMLTFTLTQLWLMLSHRACAVQCRVSLASTWVTGMHSVAC